MDKAADAAKAVATPDNIKTAQQYVDFVKTNLEPMAHQIGVSVQWLWEVLVNKARVEAITWLVIIILGTFKSILLLTIAYKALKKATFGDGYPHTYYQHKKSGKLISYEDMDYSKREEYDQVTKREHTNRQGYVVYFVGSAGTLIGVATILTSFFMTPTIVTGLVNPQFRAIERIAEFAQGQTNNH